MGGGGVPPRTVGALPPASGCGPLGLVGRSLRVVRFGGLEQGGGGMLGRGTYIKLV